MLLAEIIEREVRGQDLPMIRVDGSRGIVETSDLVERLFADALAAGPRARASVERQALLREANESIVAQIRGYHARPWAEGDPEVVEREFVCECGNPVCDLYVHLTIGELTAGPALAPSYGPAAQ